MVQSSIVIISDQSLFIEGVTSRLRQHLPQLLLNIVDPRQPDAMARIAAARPSVVLIDSTNLKTDEYCSLNKLILALAPLKIIHLDLRQEYVQVVTSEQHPVGAVRDLIGVIEQPS